MVHVRVYASKLYLIAIHSYQPSDIHVLASTGVFKNIYDNIIVVNKNFTSCLVVRSFFGEIFFSFSHYSAVCTLRRP